MLARSTENAHLHERHNPLDDYLKGAQNQAAPSPRQAKCFLLLDNSDIKQSPSASEQRKLANGVLWYQISLPSLKEAHPLYHGS
jgi:hypothetical protein